MQSLPGLYGDEVEFKDELEKNEENFVFDGVETKENSDVPLKLEINYIGGPYPENCQPLNSIKTNPNSSPFTEILINDTEPQLNTIHKKNNENEKTLQKTKIDSQNDDNLISQNTQDLHTNDDLSSKQVKVSTNYSDNSPIDSEHREQFKQQVLCTPIIVTEDIGFDESQLPSNNGNRKNGFCAEALVFMHLKKKFPNAEIVWENESEEFGKPYDITMTIDKKTHFIEVKSTEKDNFNTPFYISSQELEFCTKIEEIYTVYRVFGLVLNGNPKIYFLEDLKSKLRTNQVKILISPGNIN